MKRKLLIASFLLILLSFCIPGKKPLRIFMAGDSTMQHYDTSRTPQRGWGQVLPEYFDAETRIVNKARGGRSTKSFIAEGLWQSLVDSLQPGDYVLIEFGHNDASKNKPERYTPPDQYEVNLKRMIKEVRLKKAVPVLLTPIARRNFDKESHYKESHLAYSPRVRTVSVDLKVPMIDLDALFGEAIQKLGSEGSKEYFMHFGPDLYKAFPEGHKDDTHLRTAGAEKVAGLFVQSIRANPDPSLMLLKSHLKGE